MARPKYTPEQQLKAYWAKVDRSGGEDACWPWTASTSTDGYGKFNWAGKKEYAHRVSFLLAHGTIPPELCVLHSCDNPPCCNPDHLFLGTRIDNNKDMIRKGRQVRSETHGMHKLPDSVVMEIRQRYAVGQVTQRQLANEFGLSIPEISVLVNRKRRCP